MAFISFATLAQRVQSFNIVEAAEDVLRDNPKVIPDLIRAQLFVGLNGYDSPLAPYRSLNYAEEKHEQNPAPGFRNPDLRLTGSFYERIENRIAGGQSETYSTDSKNAKLTDKYGDGIFKLGIEALSELRRDTLQPGLVDEFIKHTGSATTY